MYILVKEGIPLGHQVNCVGHAVLACYLKFKDHPEVQDWLNDSFRKVTCIVTAQEFEEAKKFDDGVVMTENDLGNTEVAIAFRPRTDWPKRFQFYRLFR